MKNEELFDAAVAAVRDESIDTRGFEAARERVRSRWTQAAGAPPAAASSASGEAADGPEEHRIHGCGGFRALLPAYLVDALAEPKRLLVEDHTRECLGCRKALAALRRPDQGATRPAAVAASGSRALVRGRGRLALAAALTGVAVLSGALLFRSGALRPPPTALVQSIDGELAIVDASGSRAAVAGERFAGPSFVRTGGASGAVIVLVDGTKVELAERSELALGKRWDGTVLKLARGSLIVEAAAQRRGHLYVETSDCQVSVVGTIFSVNAGAKGSRVSVIDGEVHVRQGVERAVLRPGDQLATGRLLRVVPVDQEISWSRNAADYRERLAALKSLGRELDQTFISAGARTSTRLLDLSPAATTVYAALPNLTQSLGSAWDLVVRRAAENPALAEWWNERFANGADSEIADAIEQIERFGGELGAEIAVAVSLPVSSDENARPEVAVLAEVDDPARFSPLLDAEIERLNAAAENDEHGHGLRIRRVVDPVNAGASSNELLVWLAGDLFVAASSPERLTAVASAIAAGESDFVGTPFHARLARVYGEGTDWVLGVDLASVLTRHRAVADGDESSAARARTLDSLGFDELEHLVIDRTDGAGSDGAEAGQSRAALVFAGDRQGLASWLAAPAPLGALEFVSPAAHVAVAGILKEPSAIFDDFLALAAPQAEGEGEALRRLAELESRLGISFRQDLAAALGGDFAIAFDGPWLPKPSWKIVLEVVDAGRLHATVSTLVESWNQEAVLEGKPTLRWSQESVGGQLIFTLATEGDGSSTSPVELAHALATDGYLLIGPSRALLLEAVAQREAGIQLADSASFRDLLPTDGRAHVSALIYQNVGASLGALGEFLRRHVPEGDAGSASDADAASEVAELASEAGPGLAVVYAEGREISFVSKGLRGPLGLSFESLLSLGGLFHHDGDSESAAPGADPAGTAPQSTARLALDEETRARTGA